MLIIWRGYGILVLVAAVVAVMVSVVIVGATKLHQPLAGVVHTAALGLAGVGLWLFARNIESQPGRVLIDKATGREVTLRRSAGSLFFIPTRYWAYILPGLAVLGDIYFTLAPPPH